MGFLYKTYNHLCMEGMEWAVERGKARIKRETKPEEKMTFYDTYTKLDNVVKRKIDTDDNVIIHDWFEFY